MAEKTKEYTEAQKAAVLKRVKELGNVKKAAEEAGIPWQKVSMWRKAVDPSATKAAKAAAKKKAAEKASKKKTDKTAAAKMVKKTAAASKTKKTAASSKTGKTAKKTVTSAKTKKAASVKTTKTKKPVTKAVTKTTAIKADEKIKNASPLQIENAVLKSENKELRVQVERLKKALKELM